MYRTSRLSVNALLSFHRDGAIVWNEPVLKAGAPAIRFFEKTSSPVSHWRTMNNYPSMAENVVLPKDFSQFLQTLYIGHREWHEMDQEPKRPLTVVVPLVDGVKGMQFILGSHLAQRRPLYKLSDRRSSGNPSNIVVPWYSKQFCPVVMDGLLAHLCPPEQVFVFSPHFLSSTVEADGDILKLVQRHKLSQDWPNA